LVVVGNSNKKGKVMSKSLNEYVTLGRSGLRVSPLSLGTMTFGTEWGWGSEENVARDVFNSYIDAGGNFVDTANVYTEGRSEELVGKFIDERGLREQVVLATKFTFNPQPGNPNAGGNGRKNIYRSVEDSLRRLKTDYIDLYWLHAWDTVTPAEEVVSTLNDLVRAGKIRHYGVSINTMEEGIAAVKDGRAETIQVEYNLLTQEPAEKIFPLAQQANVGIIARIPLKRGILTGKLTQADEARFQGEDVRARSFKGEPFAKELAKAAQLGFLVHGPVKTLTQAAIGFCIAQPAVNVVIPGARNADQMRENAAGADVEIPPADLEKVSDLWRSGFAS